MIAVSVAKSLLIGPGGSSAFGLFMELGTYS